MSARGFWKVAVRKSIHAAGGIEAVAAALGYSKTHVGRWHSLNDADLPSDDIRIEIDELAMANGGEAEILAAQARQLGHVAFRLPEGFGASSAVTLKLTEATAEFGDIARALTRALADNRIDAREQGEVAAQIDEALVALVQLRALVIEEEADLPGVTPIRGAR